MSMSIGGRSHLLYGKVFRQDEVYTVEMKMYPSKSQPSLPNPFLQVMAVGDLTDVISERVCACTRVGFYSSTTPSTLQLDFFLITLRHRDISASAIKLSFSCTLLTVSMFHNSFN